MSLLLVMFSLISLLTVVFKLLSFLQQWKLLTKEVNREATKVLISHVRSMASTLYQQDQANSP